MSITSVLSIHLGDISYNSAFLPLHTLSTCMCKHIHTHVHVCGHVYKFPMLVSTPFDLIHDDLYNEANTMIIVYASVWLEIIMLSSNMSVNKDEIHNKRKRMVKQKSTH